MKSIALICLLFAVACAGPALRKKGNALKFKIDYITPEGKTISAKLMVCPENKIVKHNIGGAKTLEDYANMQMAVFNEEEKQCTITPLKNEFETVLEYLQDNNNTEIEITGTTRVQMAPIDSVDFEMSDIVKKFCDEADEVNVVTQEDEEEPQPEERHHAYFYRPSVYYSPYYNCFRPTSILVTSLVIPTGTSIIFPFFFLG